MYLFCVCVCVYVVVLFVADQCTDIILYTLTSQELCNNHCPLHKDAPLMRSESCSIFFGNVDINLDIKPFSE